MHTFVMRQISVGMVNGVLRPLLNGQFVFQTGTLDQGYWPDGLYTAPTDAALAFDLQKHKDLGFNLVRKHIKVEPQRWFYHADRLGLLVWQDVPSLTAQDVNPVYHAQGPSGRLSPGIVTSTQLAVLCRYTVYNEGWSERALATPNAWATPRPRTPPLKSTVLQLLSIPRTRHATSTTGTCTRPRLPLPSPARVAGWPSSRPRSFACPATITAERSLLRVELQPDRQRSQPYAVAWSRVRN